MAQELKAIGPGKQSFDVARVSQATKRAHTFGVAWIDVASSFRQLKLSDNYRGASATSR